MPIGTTFTLKDVAFRRPVFDSTITTLELEESKSELKRSYLLISLFSFIFLAAIINFFVVRDHVSNFYGGTITFITVCLFCLRVSDLSIVGVDLSEAATDNK